jgi:predicted ATPase
LKILQDPAGAGHSLYVTPRGGVPVPLAVAGDGIYSLLQTAIHLATVPKGLALLEEPEVFQHPRSLGPCASAIVAAVDRGIQVVVSTHSQELIDQLLVKAGDMRAARVAQINVSLHDGILRAHRLAGAKLLEARWTLGEDLR